MCVPQVMVGGRPSTAVRTPPPATTVQLSFSGAPPALPQAHCSNEPVRLVVTPPGGGRSQRLTVLARGLISSGRVVRQGPPTIACRFSAARLVPPTSLAFVRRRIATLRDMAGISRIVLPACGRRQPEKPRKSGGLTGQVAQGNAERNACRAASLRYPGPGRSRAHCGSRNPRSCC